MHRSMSGRSQVNGGTEVVVDVEVVDVGGPVVEVGCPVVLVVVLVDVDVGGVAVLTEQLSWHTRARLRCWRGLRFAVQLAAVQKAVTFRSSLRQFFCVIRRVCWQSRRQLRMIVHRPPTVTTHSFLLDSLPTHSSKSAFAPLTQST